MGAAFSHAQVRLQVCCYRNVFSELPKVHLPISKDNILLNHFLFQQGYFPEGPRKKIFTALFKKCLVFHVFPVNSALLRGHCLIVPESGDGKKSALPACANNFHTLLCFMN